MRTQDVKYTERKSVAQAKKIETLKSELHLLDIQGKQQNKHAFFLTPQNKLNHLMLPLTGKQPWKLQSL